MFILFKMLCNFDIVLNIIIPNSDLPPAVMVYVLLYFLLWFYNLKNLISNENYDFLVIASGGIITCRMRPKAPQNWPARSQF